jgi:hypothetical protein
MTPKQVVIVLDEWRQMEKAVMSGTLVRPCAVILNKKITSINEALA